MTLKLGGEKEQIVKFKYKPLKKILLPYVILMTVLAYQAPETGFINPQGDPPTPWLWIEMRAASISPAGGFLPPIEELGSRLTRSIVN